ncbi:PDR/VanB family oxidoreductase [Lacisediminimonas profundi]|uniref:PDR/VanB family oxidoreductase n=1 Tax=Lacisediminimonas profundi TaxID=2603856 RepID=UPI00124B61A5|nr:PDR/VanB family oxidoreductase [Lacisediminimonas profundi]
MNSIPVKVSRKSREAEDIFSYELVSADGSPLPAFTAGAHIDVQVRPGLIRQYSLCNDPGERHRYVIGVLRDPASRGGSVAIHAGIGEGDIIEVSEPRNLFPLMSARKTLLFAGGIGVTPLLSMTEQLSKTGSDFSLHYCTRSIERTAFRDRIAASRFADQVHFHLDDGAAAQRLDLQALLGHPDADTNLYVCGPAGFIEYVTGTARTLGWPARCLHVEYFTAAPQDASGDDGFEVRIASSGEVIAVAPGQSVVAALGEHGIEIPLSCEQGFCGTCLTGVLEGTPDHRDIFLTDEERSRNDQFTPCCSRSRTRMLVLDL